MFLEKKVYEFGKLHGATKVKNGLENSLCHLFSFHIYVLQMYTSIAKIHI